MLVGDICGDDAEEGSYMLSQETIIEFTSRVSVHIGDQILNLGWLGSILATLLVPKPSYIR